MLVQIFVRDKFDQTFIVYLQFNSSGRQNICHVNIGLLLSIFRSITCVSIESKTIKMLVFYIVTVYKNKIAHCSLSRV